MTRDFAEDERNLTESETLIMKAIWDADKDIAVSELIDVLRDRYQKDYARTTVVTFLIKLSDKGFARTYRKGKYSYVRALKNEEEYKAKLINESTDFWFQGNISKVLSALFGSRKISNEEMVEIWRVLDDSNNANNNY